MIFVKLKNHIDQWKISPQKIIQKPNGYFGGRFYKCRTTQPPPTMVGYTSLDALKQLQRHFTESPRTRDGLRQQKVIQPRDRPSVETLWEMRHVVKALLSLLARELLPWKSIEADPWL
jgi:hypothetical protein